MSLTIGDLTCIQYNTVACPECEGEAFCDYEGHKYPSPCELCRGVGYVNIRTALGVKECVVVFDRSSSP